MPNKFNELLLKPDIIELYNKGITPNYGYLLNGRLEKDMVRTLYPLQTLNGNPITWEASEPELLFPVVSLQPKQAGTGDPSPDNVRPISGYDSVTVTQSKDEAQVKQITLTLPETIYGGTVDAVTGVGSEEWAFVEFDGTENWEVSSAEDGKYFYLPNTNPPLAESNAGLCSCFLIGRVSYISADLTIQLPYTEVRLWRVKYDTAATAEDFKSYLATQAAAGSPVQVAYKLATPEPFQATGNQQLTSLVGYNTIYTNGDSMVLNRKARRLEV